MSLRWTLAALVAAAVVLVPTINFALLRVFPPPVPAWAQAACAADEQACTPPSGAEPRPLRVPPPPFGERGAALNWHAAREPLAPPDGVDPRNPGRGVFVAEFGELRSHFLWINLASLGLVLLGSVLLFSLLLRRPIRSLIEAIEDIEQGGVPAASGGAAPSELRQIGQALHRLGRQLRSGTQERELMLAGMSHDLRSPLARIQAAVELRAQPGEDWQPVLRDVREIDHIIGQCIDFVRDGQDEVPVRVAPDQLVRELLHRDDADLQLDLAASVPVPLRRQSLLRALRNLVDNARIHGVAPITLRTQRETGAVAFSVEDSGPGIDIADWQRLRQPFAQGTRARHPRGAGLGLAIVQRVAERHGGSLELQRGANGQTTCLRLRLPV